MPGASAVSLDKEFKRTFESGAPPYDVTAERIAMMYRATAELKASGIESTLKIGDHAPDFALFNQDHGEVSSKDLLRRGTVPKNLVRAQSSITQHVA